MSRKAHNRFLVTVCLFLTLAAFALTFAEISQGTSISDTGTGCSSKVDTSSSFIGPTETCPASSASFESVSLMLFGLGLVGFAHAIRRSFKYSG